MMLQLIIPEIILAVSASTLLGFGFHKTKDRAALVRYIAVAVLLLYSASGFIMSLLGFTLARKQEKKLKENND